MAVFPALQGGPHNHQCLACTNKTLLTKPRPRCSGTDASLPVETLQEPTISTPEGSKFGDASPSVVAQRIGGLAAQLLEAGVGPRPWQ